MGKGKGKATASLPAYVPSEIDKVLQQASRADMSVTDNLSSGEEEVEQQSSLAVLKSKRSQIDEDKSRVKKKSRKRSKGKSTAHEKVKAVENPQFELGVQPVSVTSTSMGHSLPLLNGLSEISRDPQVEVAFTAKKTKSVLVSPSPIASTSRLQPAQIDGLEDLADGQATPAMDTQQQAVRPVQRKRGRPSKADLAEREHLATLEAANHTANVSDTFATNVNDGADQPAASKKRKRTKASRRRTLTPAVDIQDSLFSAFTIPQQVQAEEERKDTLFRSMSVESELLAGTSSHIQSIPDSHQRSPSVEYEDPGDRLDKGKRRAETSELEEDIEEEDPYQDEASSSAEEEEVQKSLVQELPKRRPARKGKQATSGLANSTASVQDPGSVRKSNRVTKPKASLSTNSKAQSATATSTPKKQAGPSATPAVAPASNTADSSIPTPSSSRPEWIRTRLRRLSAVQHKNMLAHRTRSPDRVRGNPFSEDEEITLILALNDLYDDLLAPGDRSEGALAKIKHKRWRKIQEQHGAQGTMSDILSERSNVDLKDKARNIQKYREQMGLPGFIWYTLPEDYDGQEDN